VSNFSTASTVSQFFMASPSFGFYHQPLRNSPGKKGNVAAEPLPAYNRGMADERDGEQ
jgi:hypothetical protein